MGLPGARVGARNVFPTMRRFCGDWGQTSPWLRQQNQEGENGLQGKEWVRVGHGPDRVPWERELAWSQLESCSGDLLLEGGRTPLGPREQMPRGEQGQPAKDQVHPPCPRVLLTFNQ